MSRLGVARDIGTGVVVRGWTQVTALIVVIVAGRMLNTEQFGVFAMASVFMIIVTTVLYSGIYEYIIKTDDHEIVADTCFWINLGLSIAGAIIIALLAPLIGFLSHTPEVAAVMLWLAPSVLIAAFTSWQEALVLRRKQVVAYYIIWCFAETAGAAIAIALFIGGAGIYALVGYRYSTLVLTGAGYLIHARTLPRPIWRAAEARRAMQFASGLYGSRLVAIISNFGADLIIGILASPAGAGAYRLASRMVFGVSEIWFQPIKTIAWVRFSSAIRGGAGLDAEWPGLMMVLSMVAWPTLAGVAVLSGPLTDSVLGAGWRAAVPIVSILALAKATQLFEVLLDPLLGTAGETRLLLRIRSAASAAAIAGFCVLAPFGAASAAWAQAGTYGLLAGLTIQIGLQRTRITLRTLLMTLLPGGLTTLLTALAAAAAVRIASHTPWPPVTQFACEAAAGALVWAFLAGVVFRRRALAMIRSGTTAVRRPGRILRGINH